MGFKRAVKSQAKLRAAMFGPAGAGKTYSALSIATGMVGEKGKIALVDSERMTAAKYGDRFMFDIQPLESKTIEEYVGCINEAAEAGYDVLIIDSLSHAWEQLNEEVQRIADANFRGNFWSAWSKGTPKQRKLVDAILNYPGHIIATMRSKTEWQTGSSSDGKKAGPVRVGLAPEQGKGIEYEFDILFELSVDHLANIIKDRTGKFQDKIIEKPGIAFGKELVAWLNEGVYDIGQQVQDTLKEIGRIIKSQSEKGEAYFTEAEYTSIRAICGDSVKQPAEDRLQFLQNVLADQKELLQQRASALTKPATEVTQEKPDPKPETPKAPSATVKNQKDTSVPGSLAEEFKKKIEQKNGVAAQAVPDLYSESEEDGFEDDIPGEEQEPEMAAAELDIF